MHVQILKEHHWLKQLAGEWTYETECSMGPDQPPAKMSGSESARMLGDAWLVGEWEGPGPGGDIHRSIISIGFDPKLNRFVGSFIGSMMNNLWVYDGELEADGKTLVLESEGPKFDGEGMGKYRDIIEMVDADHKVMRSEAQIDDGSWQHFMTTEFRRKSSS